MKHAQKIIIRILFVLVICFALSSSVPVAKAACQSSSSTYCMLAPLPGMDSEKGIDVRVGIESYINTIIKITIGLMSVLAVIMIVVGGIQYMVSSAAGEKAGGKERITNALIGLVLALSAYLILNTINPNLVNLRLGVPKVTLTQYTDETTETYDGTVLANHRLREGVTLSTCTTVDGCARDILANSKITLKPDAADRKSGVDTNIQDASKGLPGYTSVRGDKGQISVSLRTEVLKGILAVASGGRPFTVTEILGGNHAPDSKHYRGLAFDFVPAGNLDPGTTFIMGGACESAGASLVIGPCNTNQDSLEIVYCPATELKTNKEHQDHIHCQW